MAPLLTVDSKGSQTVTTLPIALATVVTITATKKATKKATNRVLPTALVKVAIAAMMTAEEGTTATAAAPPPTTIIAAEETGQLLPNHKIQPIGP